MSILEAVLALILALYGAQEGWASQYESNATMDATVEARQRWGHLPQDVSMYDGFVATESCDHVGEELFLYREGIGFELFAVADCSGHASTTRWMKENNILVEVDHRTAVRWGVVGEGGVKIWMIPCWKQPNMCKKPKPKRRTFTIDGSAKYTPE